MGKTDIVKKQTQDYEKSLSSIVKRVEESKHKAITTVNKLLIELYWFIGETVVNLQEQGKWGDGVVEKLSQDLRVRYPEQSGFFSSKSLVYEEILSDLSEDSNSPDTVWRIRLVEQCYDFR